MLRLQTEMRRFGSSGLLLLFLANCQPVKPVVVAVPPPPTQAALPVEALKEALKSLCLAWFNSLGTWQDSDAEETINGIDFGYRRQEEVCKPYMNEGGPQ